MADKEAVEEVKFVEIFEIQVRRRILWLIGFVASALLIFLIWFGFWVTLVDKHELGFTYDRFTGEIVKLERDGWIVRTPFRYSVHTIDLRPYQVKISVDLEVSERILNAYLVRFNPDGLDTFIEWHGRKAGSTVDELKEILKCYAFDNVKGADCPFLEILGELAPNQGVMPAQ